MWVKTAVKYSLLCLASILCVAVLSLSIGIASLPYWLPPNSSAWLQQALGRNGHLGALRIDWQRGAVEVDDFTLLEQDGSPFVTLASMRVVLNWQQSLAQSGLVIDELRLTQPTVTIARNPDGSYNYTSLSQPKDTQAAKSPSRFSLRLKQLDLQGGQIIWRDARSTQFPHETLSALTLQLSGGQWPLTQPLNFKLALDSSTVGRVIADGDVLIEPKIQINTRLQLPQLRLPELWRRFAPDSSLQIQTGTAALSGDYALTFSNDKTSVAIKSSELTLDKPALSLAGENHAPLELQLNALKLSGNYALNIAETTQLAVEQSELTLAGLNANASDALPVAVQLQHARIRGQYALDIADSTKLDINGSEITLTDLTLNGDNSLPLAAQLQQGQINGQYALSFGDKTALNIQQGSAHLKTWAITERDTQKTLFDIEALSLGGVELDLARKQLHIATLESESGKLYAHLNKEGVLNYETLLATKNPNSPPIAVPTENPSTPAWSIQLDDLNLKNYQLQFQDQTPNKPVDVQLSDMNLKLQNYRNQDNTRLPLQFSTTINQTGKLQLNGDMSFEPFTANWSITLNDIELKTLQVYIDPFLRLDIINGDFNTQGQLVLSDDDKTGIHVNYQGNANIAKLLTRDRIKNKNFVRWANLAFNNMAIYWPEQRYTLEQVVLDHPYLRFTIKEDQSSNFSEIIIPQQPEKSGKTAKKTSEKPSSIQIKAVQLHNGRSDFADYSLILPFVAEMTQLNGDVKGFSSVKGSVAELNLQGKVYDLADVSIDGRYQIDNGDSTIALKFKNMSLPLVTPYMAEFAGYRIEKGQMNLDLQYQILNGELEAQNKVFIDQLQLGEKIDNPKATSLPLELAVALLKDSNGQINLDFPITGSLNDPKFSVGALIIDVLSNVIGKIALSPFNALASLFEGGGQDLSHIHFKAGKSELNGAAREQLDKLAKALQQKPELTLDIKGMSYQQLDWTEIRFVALYDQLRRMRAEELDQEGQKIRAEYLHLTDAEYKRLLTKLFMEKFPLLAEYSLLGKPQFKQTTLGDFYEIARQKLETLLEPEQQRLNDLAMARANEIAKYLIEHGGINSQRIFILAVDIEREKIDVDITAQLGLGVSR